MNRRRPLLRLALIIALAVAIWWLAFHHEFLEAAALGLLAAVVFLPPLIRGFRSPRFIEAATLRRRLELGKTTVLIDVRTADEFVGTLGHIAGSINIPITEIFARLDELTKIEGPLITI
jgi:rhodanese-like protein